MKSVSKPAIEREIEKRDADVRVAFFSFFFFFPFLFFKCVGRLFKIINDATGSRVGERNPPVLDNGRRNHWRDSVAKHFRYLYKLIVRLRGACCDLKWAREIRGLVFVGFAQQWPDHRGMCEPTARRTACSRFEGDP